jgi:hypothetical protein
MDWDPTYIAKARGWTLRILRSHASQDRPAGPSHLAAYADEDLVLSMLALRGYPLSIGQLRGAVLMYLRDAGYVLYEEIQPAGPMGSKMLLWRISDHGQAFLEGRERNDGVAV